MKKSNIPVFVFLFFLGGIAFFSLWLYVEKKNYKPSKNIYNEKHYEDFSLFNDSVVHVVKIQFEQPNFWDFLISNKEQENLLEKKTYLKGNITIDGEKIFNVGVKIKGESSYKYYPSKKKSLKINFEEFAENQKYQGVKKINLNNNFKDPTFMREKLYLDFLRYIDAPAQKSAYAKVFINDQYWGLYLLVEEIDKRFIKRNFGNNKGTFIQGEPQAYFDWHGKDASNYQKRYKIKSSNQADKTKQLVHLIDIINNSDNSKEEFETALEKEINIENCLKAWAVNNVLLNVDAYNMYYPHNFYLYHNSKSNKWEWINYDGNYSFGAWSPVFTLEQMIALDIFYIKKEGKPLPLSNKLLKENEKYKNLYKEIIRDQVLQYFVPDELNKKIESMKSLIAKSVYADTLKMYTNREFDINIEQAIGDINDPGAFIPGLKPFIKERRENIIKQLEE